MYTYAVIGHLPCLHETMQTRLWRHNRFIRDLFVQKKLFFSYPFIHKNNSITVAKHKRPPRSQTQSQTSAPVPYNQIKLP